MSLFKPLKLYHNNRASGYLEFSLERKTITLQWYKVKILLITNINKYVFIRKWRNIE